MSGFAVILTLIFCAIVGALIGGTANKSGTGFLLGLLFGPIGLIIIAILCIGGSREPKPDTIRAQVMSFPEFKKQLFEYDSAAQLLSDDELRAKYQQANSPAYPTSQQIRPTPREAPTSPKSRLEEAEKLFQQGIISEEEYTQTRKRILAEI